jgi:hypothetical protein
MKPTMYCLTFGLGLLAAVVMSVPAYSAVETAVAVGRSVSSGPTSGEEVLKLALYCNEQPDGCGGDCCFVHWW